MNKKNKNNQLTFYLILALSAIFILIAFYYEGRATERFGEGHDEHLKSFKDAVENAIPPQVGVWFSDKNEDQIGIENELIRRVAGADGALGRHYRGSFDHPDVHINITCGYSRNVGAHTPDVCFTGSGSVQETPVETFTVDYQTAIPDPTDPKKTVLQDRTAVFKTAIFSDATSHYKQRVFWGWKGVGTGWVAPRFPRMKWNSNEPICKMYVSILEDNGYSKQTVDTLKVAEEFMKLFLPELDKILTGTYVLPEGMRVINDDNIKENDSTENVNVNPTKEEDEFDLSAPAPAISETPVTGESSDDLEVKSEEPKPKDNSGDEDDPFAL